MPICRGRSTSAAGIVGAIVATFAFLSGPVAWAFEPCQADLLTVPVSYATSYATGVNGAKLAWLPYRPTAGELRADGDGQVIQADFQTPTTVAKNVSDDPMSDPFGDLGNSVSEPKAPMLAAETKPFAPKFLDPTTLPEQPMASDAEGVTTRRVPASDMPGPLLEGGVGGPTSPSMDAEQLRTLEQELAQNVARDDGCPKTSTFKPIRELTTDVRAAGDIFPKECSLKEETFNPREWTPTTFTWKASGLGHKPLYFEQIQVERYGHSFGPYVQPILSHAHFFVTVPMLPYLMGVNPPNECMYTLGYYRPGSCAPYMLDPLPISVRGALWEAGAVTGAAYLLP